MRSVILLIAIVALVALVGLVMESASTGQYIRKRVNSVGEPCGPTDACGDGFICLRGVCTYNTCQMEILPGKLCTTNTPCKYGYSCIAGRCGRA